MKNIRILIISAFLLIMSNLAYTQPPPPSRHGEENNQSPQPAPLGSGLLILLALGGAYGAAKVYKSRRGMQGVSG